MAIPILDDRLQALNPGTDPDLSGHPLSERWVVQRVVGAFNVEAFGTFGFLDAFFIHWGIVRVSAVGDAFAIPGPTTNDSCLGDWLAMGHFDLAAASHACFQCTGQATCPKDNGGCDLVDVDSPTALTAFQFHGTKTSQWQELDVRAKRRIQPEHGLYLVVEAEAGSPEAANRDVLSITPKLKVLLTKSA